MATRARSRCRNGRPLVVATGALPTSVPLRRLIRRQAAVPIKTGNERLSDKARDGGQRVDNCKVPRLRGAKVRPDTCQTMLTNGRGAPPFTAGTTGCWGGRCKESSTAMRTDEAVDVLDMWEFIEEAFEKLSTEEKERLAKEVGPWGKDVQFLGFDGNNVSEHLSIARFW